MKKLVKGIVRFRRERRPGMAAKFAELALGQKPDAMLVCCSDSRVAPNVFASTDPGDVFVVRNVGNIIPTAVASASPAGAGTAAALEFAVDRLKVKDIIICGHSDCGAMRALSAGAKGTSPLAKWLKSAGDTFKSLKKNPELAHGRPAHDRLSQAHALVQLEHLMTHKPVAAAIKAGRLRLHAWWFDVGHADVHAWEPALGRFTLIDEEEAARILARLG